MVDVIHSRMWDIEVREPSVQGHPELHRLFLKTSISFVIQPNLRIPLDTMSSS